jgi:hypothetical protein
MPSSESRLDLWNRKLHYYVGLYLLTFVWLFSVSGLLINHPGWTFASFWEKRRQERFQRALGPVSGATEMEQAREVLAQVGVSGEIGWSGSPRKGSRLVFRAARPGRSWEIDADLAARTAEVTSTALNGWGALHTLHVFSGANGPPGHARNWVMTKVWSFAMDAVAVGLVFMVGSGWWVWLGSGRRRRTGFAALAAGAAVAAAFLLA